MTAADETMFPISEGELHRIESPFIQQGIELETFARIRARGPIERAPIESIQACLAPCYNDCQYQGKSYRCVSLEHDAEVAARITAQLTAQHEQELRDAVEGAKTGERERTAYAYLISIGSIDSHESRYICDSSERALELFNELRNEIIADYKEQIEFERQEGYDLTISHTLEIIAFLEKMKPGDIPPWCCDHPTIEVFPFLRSTGSNPGEREQRAELPPSMPEGGTDPMK